jgi:hypothetical protein
LFLLSNIGVFERKKNRLFGMMVIGFDRRKNEKGNEIVNGIDHFFVFVCRRLRQQPSDFGP